MYGYQNFFLYTEIFLPASDIQYCLEPMHNNQFYFV